MEDEPDHAGARFVGSSSADAAGEERRTVKRKGRLPVADEANRQPDLCAERILRIRP
jgi:hypothetical protein